MSDQVAKKTTAEHAAALFEFLVQLVHLRTQSVRDVDQYASASGDVLWFSELPDQPEVKTAIDAQDQPEEWLVLKRPRRAQPPELPQNLLGWVDNDAVSDPDRPLLIHDPAQIAVKHRDATGLRSFVVEDHALADHPDVVTAWAAYQIAWASWATEARRVGPVVEVYTRLFAMQQRAGQLGEQYEIVIASGLLLAQTRPGIVRRHLLTRRAKIVVEETTGRIAVVPDEDSVEASIETDMLDGELAVGADVLVALRSRLEDVGTRILTRADVLPVLETWINAASPVGYVEMSSVPPSAAHDETPRLVFAPAVILRPRSQRSLVSLYGALIDQLHSGVEPPELVRGLVEIIEPSLSAQEVDAASREIPEVYFPLPANDEQLRIVDRLRSHRGVVVVGPPGTGKSHTIANIVSDALAHGKRVVVTSHTSRALEVLVEKLPPDVRDLCVIMAGEGRGLSVELRRSVDAILERSSDPDWTAESAGATADRTRRALRKAQDERATILARRRELRQRETTEQDLKFGGYTGTLARIAERLASEHDALGWIPDEVTGDPPLAVQEVIEWLALELRVRDGVESQARQVVPAESEIPGPDVFAALIDNWRDASDDVQHAPELEADPVWVPLAAAPREDRGRAREALRALRRAVGAIDATLPWVPEVLRDILAGLDSPWRARAEETGRVEQVLAAHGPAADRVHVDRLDDLDARTVRLQAVALSLHLAGGGSLGFGPFKPRPVRAAAPWLKVVTVDGAHPTTLSLLDALLAHLECAIAIDDLAASWGDRIRIDERSFAVTRGVVIELMERLEPTLALDSLRDAARMAVHALDGISEPVWSDPAELRRLEYVVGAVDAVRRRDDGEAAVARLAERLSTFGSRRDAAPQVSELASTVVAKDVRAYAEAHAQLGAIRLLNESLRRRDALFERVAESAPQLARAVREDPAAPEWQAWSQDFDSAWAHSRASAWVREQLDGGEVATLDQQLARLDDRLRLYTRQLGATLAWRTALGRLSQHHKAHLQAYRKYMAKVGKGTGKYAAMNLALARQSMNECIDAVPAWIMPTYRLAETLTPRFEPFDLAIVDEASQSGVESLFVWALARQVVVVGDDQQISPEAVGVSPAAVASIAAVYIPNIPLAGLFRPDVSIFDQAQIRYPGKLQLREHFRCMPEIIAFSNRLSYGSSPLEPVRQFGMDRLPPLRAVHVAGAEEANGINRREAEALVDQLIDCCGDPAYKEASMGVISLTGDRQAAYIQRRLIERLGPEAMLEHRIKCGNAYAFQGDQRRVMFLSMVAAPSADGHRLSALTAQNIQQRFNVASSRAEDQAWLFHSVTAGDLNPICLRARLLAHFLDPAGAEDPALAEVSTTDLQSPFDSLFEQRVCRRLRDRGYRVVPQHKVLNYRIDLVVEGGAAKLAVECDGDAWHGAEEYERDLGRQRDLERCGWRFVRIPESLFYLDSDEAMAPIWETLDRLGIRPISVGQPTAIGSLDSAEAVSLRLLPKAEVAAPEADRVEEQPHDVPPPARTVVTIGPKVAAGRRFDGTLHMDEEPEGTGSPPPITLSSYRAWQPHPLPALVSPSPPVREAVLEIVSVEGPILIRRLADLYTHALGRTYLTRAQRHVFNAAVFSLIQNRQLASEAQLGQDEMAQWTVRVAGTEPVLLRERGPRSLIDVPPTELTEAARAVAPAGIAEDDLITRLCILYQVSSRIALHRQHVAAVIGRGLATVDERPRVQFPQTPTLSIATPGTPPPRSATSFAEAPPQHSADRLTRELEGDIEQAVNDALGLGLAGLKRLAEAWDDGPQVTETRAALFVHLHSLGVLLDERTIVERVREQMPNTMGAARGAVVDTALARFAGRYVDPEPVATLLKPWELASSGPRTHAQDPVQVCSHGIPWGQCRHPGCPGRFLGSAWTETDWRNNR